MLSPDIAVPAIIGIVIIISIVVFIVKTARTAVPLELPAAPAIPDLDFQGHLREGNALLGDNKHQEALLHFQAASRQRPKEPTLHFKVGRVFALLEDYDSALEAFHRALKLNPDQIETHYEIARIYSKMQDLPRALERVEEALKVHPDHEQSLLLKIKLLEQQGDSASTLPILRRLVGVSRSPFKIREKWAETALQVGMTDDARAEYEALLTEDPAQAIAYRQKIAEIHMDSGHPQNAIDLLKDALSSLPKATTAETADNADTPTPITPEEALLKKKLSEALYQQALLQINGIETAEGEMVTDAPQAQSLLQEALRYDPDNASLHQQLGKVSLKQGDKSQALDCFTRAVELNPVDAISLFDLASIQEDRSQIDEAIANYERVLKLEPRHAEAHFALGTLYGMENRLELSIRHLHMALSIQPHFVDALYNLGVALEQNQDFRQATNTYKKVLQISPTHEKAKSNLAHLRHIGKGG